MSNAPKLTPIKLKDFTATNVISCALRKNAELITYKMGKFFSKTFPEVIKAKNPASLAIKIADEVDFDQQEKQYRDDLGKVITRQEFSVVAHKEKRSLILFSNNMEKTLDVIKKESENPAYPVLHAYKEDIFYLSILVGKQLKKHAHENTQLSAARSLYVG